MTHTSLNPGDPGLAAELTRALQGEVRFDRFTRGLYSTDASHYQIEPLGVVFPRTVADVEATMEVARNRGVPVLPRGGGTSQCGQTVGRAVVMDTSRYLTGIGTAPDAPADGMDPYIEVEPGVVLDHLNARLRPQGLWFPVDPSTSSRATLGGMAGNNSAGSRSLKYGMMVDNVAAVEVVLPDGRRLWLGDHASGGEAIPDELAALRALFAREADEIGRRTPRTLRNVAGYNLDRLHPDKEHLAQLLVGSEGTLAFFSRLRLKLARIPKSRVLAACHFSSLTAALDTVQHMVRLGPSAIELVDRTVLQLAAERPDFRGIIEGFVRGDPAATLLVEFSSEDATATLGRSLDDLESLLGDLGYPDCVVRVEDASEQARVWNVRKAGLSIVMSMAGPRRPISFIEDCAVPLEHLAEYARRVDEIFASNGAEGTWYAHASVGCLHVRPALNLKDPEDVSRVRAIAEATHEAVRELEGTHSGEHGDGLLRSEFLRSMLGDRMADAYAEVKRTFDPQGMMNPGKIVAPPRMDDRALFRFRPEYEGRDLPVVLDWSKHGSFLGAVERCDNNGACRKYQPDVMCPSFRVTSDERHSTRGRANALRLALTGQLDADRTDGLDSPDMAEAMSLCISCKACRRECPTGVDMAKMKLEWQHRQNALRGVGLGERVLAALPRVAPRMRRLAPLLNLGGRSPLTRLLGIAPQRALPRWSSKPWRDDELPRVDSPDVVLFVDTFTRWFEPENARAAVRVLQAGGWSVMSASAHGERPLCCGRTYLSAGMLDEAHEEGGRMIAALASYAQSDAWIVGLEPSCLYTLRDEIPALLPGGDAELIASRAVLLEEFLDQEWETGREVPFTQLGNGAASSHPVLVHGHCHQKAFGATDATLRMLQRLPGQDVSLIESSCCGMAGAFGYHAEHYDVSMAMGELTLLPAVREADADAVIVADGTSCRAQIEDGTGRQAVHAAVVLAGAL
ncbi:MAG: FAD-binding protein [Gemmatimonadota bacterium]|nr:FAD-binding protein [Gemmatimonadota bacterium]